MAEKRRLKPTKSGISEKNPEKEPADLHVYFAYNLKQLRIYKGLTQEQVGKLIKPPLLRETIADAERGRTSPTLDFVQKVADALRVTPLVLLDDTLDEDVQSMIARHNSLRKIYPYPAKKIALIKKSMKTVRRVP